jgi:hypothetical protein
MASQASPDKIVRKALDRGELDLLLLGVPKYQYFDRWSGCPYNTDHPSLLSALYLLAENGQEVRIRDSLIAAIKKIIDTYDGLLPVAACILYESGQQFNDKYTLGLPLLDIASELRQQITVFSFRLIDDRSGVGAEWPNGRLGDFRRLSKNTVENGGPLFCDEL